MTRLFLGIITARSMCESSSACCSAQSNKHIQQKTVLMFVSVRKAVLPYESFFYLTTTCLLQSCVYGENRTSIQCTTPSLAKLSLQPPVVTKVAFILDGYRTDEWDLIYVEDPLFQDPKLTSKDNKSIVELKVRVLRLEANKIF